MDDINLLFRHNVGDRIYLPGPYGQHAALAGLRRRIRRSGNGGKALQHHPILQNILPIARLRLACRSSKGSGQSRLHTLHRRKSGEKPVPPGRRGCYLQTHQARLGRHAARKRLMQSREQEARQPFAHADPVPSAG